MRCVCKYDKLRDVQAVEPNGYVDLAKMNATGSIPAQVALSDEHYNAIENPNSIAGRVSDDFEAMQANKAIASYKPPKKSDGDAYNKDVGDGYSQ